MSILKRVTMSKGSTTPTFSNVYAETLKEKARNAGKRALSHYGNVSVYTSMVALAKNQ